MTETDPFGHDPQVQYLRRVFTHMEKKQNILLEKAGMTSLDGRLRRFRETALKIFEKAWGEAIQRGVVKSEEDAAALYLYCFSQALCTGGITVPTDTLPEHKEIHRFVKEVLK